MCSLPVTTEGKEDERRIVIIIIIIIIVYRIKLYICYIEDDYMISLGIYYNNKPLKHCWLKAEEKRKGKNKENRTNEFVS